MTDENKHFIYSEQSMRIINNHYERRGEERRKGKGEKERV